MHDPKHFGYSNSPIAQIAIDPSGDQHEQVISVIAQGYEYGYGKPTDPVEPDNPVPANDEQEQ